MLSRSISHLSFCWVVGFLLTLSGCMNRATVNIDPGTDLSVIRSIHVEKFAPDGRGIDQMIARRLVGMGYQASSGAFIPPSVDAKMTYEDKWVWDMSLYMMQLTIVLRDKDGGFPLATANSVHGSLTRKSPDEMIAEVLGSMFGSVSAAVGGVR